MANICTCCQRKLNPATAVRLELNLATGHYRNQDVHEQFSQSGFEFAPACARNALAAARSASISAIKAQQAINGSWDSTPTPAALPATKTMNPNNITTAESLAAYNKMLVEVLQPRPAGPASIAVPFVIITPDTPAETVVRRAARKVATIAITYTQRVDAVAEPERFQYECAETGSIVCNDLVQTLAKADLVLAAAAKTIFAYAMTGLRALPTTQRAKVEMQLCLEESARALRPLLLRQAGLC